MPSSRRPIWSDTLTGPLAAVIPAARRPFALRAIKAFHTAAFLAISGAIIVFTWEGIQGRRGVLARAAASIAAGESIVYASNNLVCPLTPLAEELGARSGSVTDIYLPTWVSERIPLFGGSVLLLGVVAHVVAWRHRPGGPTSRQRR
jgi:HAMP domain-containing protein